MRHLYLKFAILYWKHKYVYRDSSSNVCYDLFIYIQMSARRRVCGILHVLRWIEHLRLNSRLLSFASPNRSPQAVSKTKLTQFVFQRSTFSSYSPEELFAKRTLQPSFNKPSFRQMSSCHNTTSNPGKRAAKPATGPSKVSRTGATQSHPTHHRSTLGADGVEAMSVDDTSETMKTQEIGGLEILEAPIKSFSDKKSYRWEMQMLFWN